MIDKEGSKLYQADKISTEMFREIAGQKQADRGTMKIRSRKKDAKHGDRGIKGNDRQNGHPYVYMKEMQHNVQREVRRNESNYDTEKRGMAVCDVTINQKGFYSVSFHGTIAPGSNQRFPASILLSLQQNGTAVPSAALSHNFQMPNETSNLSFTQIIRVDQLPATINVVTQGGEILYNNIAVTINKIGDL